LTILIINHTAILSNFEVRYCAHCFNASTCPWTSFDSSKRECSRSLTLIYHKELHSCFSAECPLWGADPSGIRPIIISRCPLVYSRIFDYEMTPSRNPNQLLIDSEIAGLRHSLCSASPASSPPFFRLNALSGNIGLTNEEFAWRPTDLPMDITSNGTSTVGCFSYLQ